jgi:hypothetical protein
LGLFVEHLVGTLNSKGLKTLFKSNQPPANRRKPTQTIHAHSVFTVCACNNRKQEKEKWGCGEFRVSEFLGGKWGKRGKWGVTEVLQWRSGGAVVVRWWHEKMGGGFVAWV